MGLLDHLADLLAAHALCFLFNIALLCHFRLLGDRSLDLCRFGFLYFFFWVTTINVVLELDLRCETSSAIFERTFDVINLEAGRRGHLRFLITAVCWLREKLFLLAKTLTVLGLFHGRGDDLNLLFFLLWLFRVVV